MTQPSAATQTRPWLRRNLAGLIALAVVAPATAFAVTVPEWTAHYAVRPSVPIESDGETLEFAGATWGPAEATSSSTLGLQTDTDSTLPADAQLVLVTIPVTPGAESPLCSTPVLREATGAQRRWNDSTLDVDWPSGEDHPTSCTSDRTTPYTLTVPYLVPQDATGPFLVDVVVAEQLPEFARFRVNPSAATP